MKPVIGLIVIFLTSHFAWSQSSTLKVETPEQQYRMMLIKSRTELGKLSPVHEKIFQEEVLRNPEFFIKNLKQERGRFFGDVDLNTIRDYIEFPIQNTAKINYLFDSQCTSCVAVTDEVKKIVQIYWGRRVLNELKSESAPELISQIYIRNKPHQIGDSEYDSQGHQIWVRHEFNGAVATQAVVLNTSAPILPAFNKVFLSSIADLGSKIRVSKRAQMLDTTAPVLVHVSPLREFSVYEKLNQAIRSQFENTQPHRLSRGVGIFMVRGLNDPTSLVQFLKSNPSGMKIRSVQVSPDQANRIEVKLE